MLFTQIEFLCLLSACLTSLLRVGNSRARKVFLLLATSLADFWRRWQISLSTWLQDCLYIPLGGNRKGPRRTYVNLMVTMLLGRLARNPGDALGAGKGSAGRRLVHAGGSGLVVVAGRGFPTAELQTLHLFSVLNLDRLPGKRYRRLPGSAALP